MKKFLFPSSNAAFLLYDITRPNTLDNITEWASIVRQKGGPIPIMLVGAKIDLEQSQRQIEREYGIQIANRNDFASFVEISAKTGMNVTKAFDVLTEITLERTEKKL